MIDDAVNSALSHLGMGVIPSSAPSRYEMSTRSQGRFQNLETGGGGVQVDGCLIIILSPFRNLDLDYFDLVVKQHPFQFSDPVHWSSALPETTLLSIN